VDWLLIAASQGDPSWATYTLTVVWTIFKVAAGLGFVIFVHELGHFLVAKACGVKCEKFYIGFDIFNLRICRFQWGETEYGIGALPLGGYVKMLGQDDDPRNYQKEVERSALGSAEADTERAKAIAEGKAAEALTAGKTVETQDQKPVIDPRSYLAKSVPARMAIISAGVIMNVIFAVIMAAGAYKMGVTDTPAMVGGVAPGSPAWMAGWQPGDRIVQFGKRGVPSENLRFMDVTKQVVFNGRRGPIDILIRHPNGEDEWFAVQPAVADPKRPNRSRMLGVVGPASRKVAAPLAPKLFPHAQTEPPLEARDEVIAVNGTSVTEEAGKPIAHAGLLLAELARHPEGSLTLTVLRYEYNEDDEPTSQEPQRLEIKVPEVPMRGLGVVMKIAPISAVQPKSPAAEAGVQVGDLLESVDGKPVGDPLSLPQRLVSKIGEEVKLGVKRGQESREFTLKMGAPAIAEGPQLTGGAIGIRGLGIAYGISNEIAAVLPGSTAEDAGLRPGQAITELQFASRDEQQDKKQDKKTEAKKDEQNAEQQDAERQLMLGMKPGKPLSIQSSGLHSWVRAAAVLHACPVGTEIKLTVATEGKWETKKVATEQLAGVFDASRDLNFSGLKAVQKAETWGEAFQLGLHRTKENLLEVVVMLLRLGSRDVSAANISGPVGILGYTYQVAKQGFPDLLMLLSYLGANLAVINLLPIPVLDGGHLVFLAYEGIRGKPADPEWQIRLSVVGLLFLLSVMVFATAMDFGLREFFLN
jgi:regulator of sigma E protease